MASLDDAHLLCLAVMVRTTFGAVGWARKSDCAQNGVLEIEATWGGLHAPECVPGGTWRTTTDASRRALAGDLTPTSDILTGALVASTGARRTTLPIGIGPSG